MNRNKNEFKNVRMFRFFSSDFLNFNMNKFSLNFTMNKHKQFIFNHSELVEVGYIGTF